MRLILSGKKGYPGHWPPYLLTITNAFPATLAIADFMSFLVQPAQLMLNNST
jgi:hypothetical protein